MRFSRLSCLWILPSCALLVLALWTEPAGAQVMELSVGITPNCPYGLKACWAGAHEALGRIEGVKSVAITPDSFNCTATIRINGDGLPDPDTWASQFKSRVDQAYLFRGVEVTVQGTLQGEGENLTLRVPGVDQPIRLLPLNNKLQWNFKKSAARQPEPDERDALKQLANRRNEDKEATYQVQVTGPLKKGDKGYVVEVREFFTMKVDRKNQ